MPPGYYAVSVESKDRGGTSGDARLVLTGEAFPPYPLTVAVLDAPSDAPLARVFLASEAGPVHVDIHRPGGGVDTRILKGCGGHYLDVLPGSSVRAFVIRNGVLEKAEASAPVARDPLRIEFATAVDPFQSGQLDVLVSGGDGRPAGNVEVFAALTDGTRFASYRAPFALETPSPIAAPVPTGPLLESLLFQSTLLNTSGFLRWSEAVMPELETEKHDLMKATPRFSCMGIPSPPSLPTLRRRSRPQPSTVGSWGWPQPDLPSQWPSPRLESAPALFQPRAITDSQGRVRIPFQASPKGRWLLTIRAVDRDGRRGTLARFVG